MADSRFPTTQIASSDFVISAGCILFRKSPTTNHLQICLIHFQSRGGSKEWLLPKGRKDLGENIAATAVRETYEETGYPCELLPCRMSTRAPDPLVHRTDIGAHLVDDATEPAVITLRNMGKDGYKIIWWFAGRVRGAKVLGTQMENEHYTSDFFDAKEAVEKLTYKSDQDVVSKVLAVVEENVKTRGMDVMFPYF